MAEWAYIGSIENYEDAVQVVLEGINMKVDPRKVLWCNYPALGVEHDELLDKVRKDTRKLEKEFGDDLCLSKLWYVGIPRFKLIRRDVPNLSCEIDLYYIASDTSDQNCNLCWFGKILPRVDTFDIPLYIITPIIDALKSNEAETKQAHIVERTSGYSVYEFMGREWKTPDAFLGFVWALAENGRGFEGLLDPASCLLMSKFTKELPSRETAKLTDVDDYQTIVTCLRERMGYTRSKAEEAAKYVTEKAPNESLEDKIKQALNYLSG